MSDPSGPSTKAIKKSAFSCDPCRRRKVKCGGERPSCNRCIARNDTCLYKLSPTLTYTERLESQVKDLKALVAQLQSQAAGPRSEVTTPQETSVGSLAGSFDGLKLDDKGGITYHGATSFFQLPTSQTPESDHARNSSARPHDIDDGGLRRERLVTNAWQQRALETLAQTPEPFQFMLDYHWCWVQPLFNFVYRPAFTRDMEWLGPYYSHTLLNAMLSHSVRWCKKDPKIRQLLIPYDDGQLFSRQSRALLFEELTLGQCKVPTVQTLLLLSAQECSAGNRSQAWLYSGMAFRLIEDMGICIDGQKYASNVQLSDEDIEIRHRLFWSCYFWDKIISLYLGRSPTLQHSTVSPPEIMLDDSAETELWVPHGIVYPPGMEYPPMQAHSTSCFMRMCQLSKIFNQILIHIYDPLGQNSEDEIRTCLVSEGEALRKWWNELPDFLQIDVKQPPSHCPPSHIVTLNCLYHAFKILLYRPMLFRRSSHASRPDPHHLVECITSATSIIAIFDLFCRTFGESYSILSLSYCVYTAASIFLLQVQAAETQDQHTIKRLQFCIQALDRVKVSNPVIGGSLSLITQALAKMGINLSANPLSSPKQIVYRPLSNDPNIVFQYNHSTQAGALSYETSGLPQTLPMDNFNIDNFDISTEMLDAFSSLEPIDATVGALYDHEL